jgi:hypothetical protein
MLVTDAMQLLRRKNESLFIRKPPDIIRCTQFAYGRDPTQHDGHHWLKSYAGHRNCADPLPIREAYEQHLVIRAS